MIASFGNEFISAEVFYNGTNMHTVKYIREGEVVFTNMVFNDDRESGEKDSIDMAEASGTETHLVSLSGCDHKFEGYYEMLVEAVVPWVIENLLVKYTK